MSFSLPAFLEIAIGLVFIYLILSLLASEIQELFAGFWQWRARHLKKSIYLMLGGQETNESELEKKLKLSEQDIEQEDEIVKLIHKLYKHYEISSLKQSPLGIIAKSKNQFGPSYIPKDFFAEAFIDILADKHNDFNFKNLITEFANNKPNLEDRGSSQTEDLEKKIFKLANKTLNEKGMLVENINENLEPEKLSSLFTQFKTEIGTWFQHSQERTSGTYKRNSKIVLFFIGFLAAILANADTFHIIENLHDESVREAIVSQASNTVSQCQDKKDDQGQSACLKEQVDAALELNDLPMGWSIFSEEAQATKSSTSDRQVKLLLYIGKKLPGYTVTALAIMMGATFWFDLLKKLINVRNAGPKPKSSSSSSEATTTN